MCLANIFFIMVNSYFSVVLMPFLLFYYTYCFVLRCKDMSKENSEGKKMIEKRKIPRLFDKSQIIGGLNRI